MAGFAGYDMPIQYPTGVLTEHLHTREKMRPVRRVAHGPGDPRRTECGCVRLETLVPGDINFGLAAAARATRNSWPTTAAFSTT